MLEPAPEEAVSVNEKIRRGKEKRVIMKIGHPQDLGNKILGVFERARSGRRRPGVRRGQCTRDPMPWRRECALITGYLDRFTSLLR